MSAPKRSVPRPSLPPPPPELRFLSWPLRDEVLLAWPLMLGATAIAIAAGQLSHSVIMGFASWLALVATLWRLWMPVEYSLGPRGIVQTVLRRRQRIPWSAIAGYEVRRRGILLLPELERSALSSLRGLYLPYSTQSKQVLQTVRYYLGPTDIFGYEPAK